MRAQPTPPLPDLAPAERNDPGAYRCPDCDGDVRYDVGAGDEWQSAPCATCDRSGWVVADAAEPTSTEEE